MHRSLIVLAAFAIVLTLHLEECNALNILGVFPTPWKSHYIAGGTLMRGLAAAGHNVSVVSPYPSNKSIPNFRDIRVLGINEAIREYAGEHNRTTQSYINPLKAMYHFYDLNILITKYTLTHPAMVELLSNKDEHFDVIIVEVILTDALLGLGQHFNAPVIGFSPFGATLSTAALVGTPVPMSYVPNWMLNFSDRMSFGQRMINVLFTIFDVTSSIVYSSYQEEIYNTVFTRKDKLSYDEMRKSVSLVLLNQHFSTNIPRPYVPNMVEIGGIQINRNEPKQLPDDIQEFVEGAEHGVIYMSLGTNVLSSELPLHIRDGILRSFGKRKERILWKWEETELPGKPDNVMIKKWFPQDDVLGHPNVKLFITHGGLLSLSETIYHGLPIIGIPFMGDQLMNMVKAVSQGYAIQVDYANLTETSLSWALQEILTHQIYSAKARELSARYIDQPMKPLDLAMFWVEYVARHKGAPHIQSAGQSLSFVQYHSLDVFAALIGVFAIFLILFYGAMFVMCCRRKSTKIVSPKHKNE